MKRVISHQNGNSQIKDAAGNNMTNASTRGKRMSQLIETLNPIRNKLTYPLGTIKMKTVQVAIYQKPDVTSLKETRTRIPNLRRKKKLN